MTGMTKNDHNPWFLPTYYTEEDFSRAFHDGVTFRFIGSHLILYEVFIVIACLLVTCSLPAINLVSNIWGYLSLVAALGVMAYSLLLIIYLRRFLQVAPEGISYREYFRSKFLLWGNIVRIQAKKEQNFDTSVKYLSTASLTLRGGRSWDIFVNLWTTRLIPKRELRESIWFLLNVYWRLGR